MFNKFFCTIIILSLFFTGCGFSPLSPRSNNKINNNGTIEDIKNNQNGLMLDLANIRQRLEVMARDVENLQQGILNSNNKNFGVQIFQGEGGIIAGLGLFAILGILTLNYRSKAQKYKKTAEVIAEEVKSLKNKNLEDNIYIKALKNNVEENVYKMLKS
jgi:hypothetical protein